MAKTTATLALLLALVPLAGCIGVTTIRNGQATTLPSGPPASACERAGFYELAPAQVFTRAEQSITTNVETAPTGLAIFPAGTSEPLLLPDILPELEEPALASSHLLRVESINAKLSRQATWRAIGVPLTLSMLIASTTVTLVGAAGDDFGVAGIGLIGLGATLVVSMVTLVGVLVNQPTALEKIHVDTRNRLFLEGEDDLQAAARGVDRHNQAVRASCH